jgi:hypothetical protein
MMNHVRRFEHEAPEAPIITRVSHPLATIWLARERGEEASYFYGGTRLIEHFVGESEVVEILFRLMEGESSVKNRLINWAIEDGALNEFVAELPNGFLQSRVGGARCLIQPQTQEIAASLRDPADPRNAHTTAAILQCVGEILNEREPKIKLTPDFGRYAGLADVLRQYTPNVLGISCEEGGCGGKSSYSVTGVLAGFEKTAPLYDELPPVTCIGSAGAMGSGVLNYFLAREPANLAVCDLVYDDAASDLRVPDGCARLKSCAGSFSAESLARGGTIIATTVGDELANSPWELIPRGSTFLLAHNLALPAGQKGIELARNLALNGVLLIPGQVLTLGGALTARLEWYWRQLPAKTAFNKDLAHRIVNHLVTHLMNAILDAAQLTSVAPYQAMLQLSAVQQRVNSSLVPNV